MKKPVTDWQTKQRLSIKTYLNTLYKNSAHSVQQLFSIYKQMTREI